MNNKELKTGIKLIKTNRYNLTVNIEQMEDEINLELEKIENNGFKYTIINSQLISFNNSQTLILTLYIVKDCVY